jgi:hypothetical protein
MSAEPDTKTRRITMSAEPDTKTRRITMSAERDTNQQTAPSEQDYTHSEHGSDQGEASSSNYLPLDSIQYTLDWIQDFKARGERDYGLWVEYGETFPAWTENMFETRVDADTRTKLRNALRTSGVWVSAKRFMKVSGALADAANEEEPSEWPQGEVQAMSLKGEFNSWRNTVDPEAEQARRQAFSAIPIDKIREMALLPLIPPQQLPRPTTELCTTPKIPPERTIPREQPSAHERAPPSDLLLRSRYPSRNPLSPTSPKFEKVPEIPSLQPPQLTHGFGRGLATLMKIYDGKLKYHRGEDLLDMSIRVFKDLCPKAGVRPEEYHDTFSTMLTGEASEFYYQKLARKNLPLDEIIKAIRLNFKTKEH